MISFNDLIQDPLQFQSFVRTLSDDFIKPKFPNYTLDTYSETREWKAVSAVNGRIPMASLIDTYSGKPIIGSEKPLDMYGDMPTFGNKVTFSAKEFTKISVIERGIAEKVANPQQLIAYVFNYFQRLAIGPLITHDKLFFEAFSNGTSTINPADNLSGLAMSIDWKINKTNCATVWSNAASANGLQDLENMYWNARNNYGVIFDKFTMNRATFNLLKNQVATKTAIASYFTDGQGMTKYMGTPSKDAINKVLVEGLMLPPIEILDYMVSTYNPDGITIKRTDSAFLDNRVTGTVGDVIAEYIWTPADEQRRPDGDTIYQDINHVLISKRSERGVVTFESELSAICVPTLMDQMLILITDATA